MGQSGSGKTTLLNVMGGLDTEWMGVVEVGGQPIATMNDRTLSRLRNGCIGFVFQHFHLLQHLSCLENVMLPGFFGSPHGGDLGERARDVLERVGLGARVDSLPGELSGGQKQRVAIARALCNRPKIMLCDEPTGSLDRNTGLTILDIFDELNRSEGMTVVLVTHEEYVSERARRIIRIEDGRVVADSACPTPPAEESE
jgi:putative ABC transport system ATP-binding protein